MDDGKPKRSKLPLGVALGMMFGLTIGVAALDNIGAGIGIGIIFGAGFGLALDAKKK